MAAAPVVKINSRRIDRVAIARAVRIISGGGVVAYPTETVYGLGADALNPRAVKRIFQIKGRSPDKPLIVLVRNRRELRALVKEIPPPAKRLMDRFWPDGLTLIFETSGSVPKEILGGGTSIALRISSSRIVRALLDGARVPLTSPSANLAGHVPPVTAGEVQEKLGGRIDLIVDGGESTQNVPSTILDVRQEPALLLRSGRIALKEIQSEIEVRDPSPDAPAVSSSILLVCTGNTCRSAMAAGLLKMLLRETGGDDIMVRSAGTHAIDGQPASRWALQVARSEDKIDLSGHSSRQMTKGLIEEASLILTMSLSQAVAIEQLGKDHARKTHLLTAYLNTGRGCTEDIQDPMGREKEVYLRTYRLIKRELERILPALIKMPKSRSS